MLDRIYTALNKKQIRWERFNASVDMGLFSLRTTKTMKWMDRKLMRQFFDKQIKIVN